MSLNNEKKLYHKGRFEQIPIYLGKFFRMFLYQDDWKVLPMSAIIAGLVAFVVGKNMFVTMEATLKGSLALTCVCVWNGFFNSIQSICRERDIVKREHRNGMHITSYIAAHMIYQAFLCIMQAGIALTIYHYAGLAFPKTGFVTQNFYVDIFITFFLITYASDMMSLMISAMVRNTTIAMTVMPFALIFELLFSSVMFTLQGFAHSLTNLSIAKWGIRCICAQADFNSLPSTAAWYQLVKMQNMDVNGMTPIKMFVDYIKQNNMVDDFNLYVGNNSTIADYAKDLDNILNCWGSLIVFALLFAIIAVIFLKRIDKDKR